MGMGWREESGDCLASCMQMTWFCDESEKDLGSMVGCFFEVFRRRGLKVNAGKSKLMVLCGEEELECEVCIDRIRLQHVAGFKYLDKSGTDEAECSKKMPSGMRVAGAIRSLVNDRSLQLECARVLDKSLLVPVLTYGSETTIRREKERSRIWAAQIWIWAGYQENG